MNCERRWAVLVLCCLLAAPGCWWRDANKASGQLPAEEWQALYFGGQRVGHGHTTRSEVEIEGRTLLRTRNESVLQMKRLGQIIRSSVVMESLQTPAGELVSFHSEMTAPGTSIVADGVVETLGESRKLMITTSGQGGGDQFMRAWSKDFRGPFGLEEVLSENLLEPGESREFTGLVAMENQAAKFELRAVDYETTELLEGETELLRVDIQYTIPGKMPVASTVWVDRQGHVVKQHMASVDQASYAVSREVALAEQEAPQLDLMKLTLVGVEPPVGDPHRLQQMVYRARLTEANPAEVFLVGESQAVRSIDEHTAEITVRALRGGKGTPGDGAEAGFVPSDPPSAADSAPNSLIQSDDPAVVALAESIAPGEEDPWRLALALERGVSQLIDEKNFSQAFASAAEVARSREGDCTEHAVLLAAVCRARGLPARVAVGLVYHPPSRGYLFHMWNEVWIDGRWIPMDAAWDMGGIGPAHLKISQSSLEGSSAMSSFMPVMQVMRQLELEIESAE